MLFFLSSQYSIPIPELALSVYSNVSVYLSISPSGLWDYVSYSSYV